MKNNASVISELQEKSNGLYFISEADYPFEIVDWQIKEITPEYLCSFKSG